MKRKFFIFLAKANKVLLPSLTKNKADIMNLSMAQKILLGWRLWVTKNSLP